GSVGVGGGSSKAKKRRNTWLMSCCNHKGDSFSNTLFRVFAEEGKAKAIAFDEIDKAPEEKKTEITIATVCF
ncbi:unnamed protein product, partial [Brassica rapa subsp. narinosa]